ncbi:TIGR03668 family PPOX class F420-dependent oxidoreductase [Nakamurella sp.]|uniref:TIGR03668 family PPOX class F420-dependent oxidoreductase n=1 Tax=Nakamurella sp. TaxID=1869182 RepID=UPI003B3A1A25
MRIPVALARERFLASPVARLATVDGSGAPHLVPVTFACVARDGVDRLVFAVDHKPKTTTRLRRLDNIAANPAVCFLVDEYDDDWARLWWVRADARAEVLDGGLRDAALAALTGRYRQYRERVPDGPVVGARVVRWTGWAAADPAPGAATTAT